jgi:hypothetical protein
MGLEDEDPMGMPGMGPTEEERIAGWFENEVLIRNQPKLALQLCHMTNSGESVINEWANEDLEGHDPMSVASTIYGFAVEDAQEMTSVARYVIIALGDQGRRFARVAFRITPDELQRAQGGETENPSTPEGLLSQTYRHNEVLARMGAATHMQTMRQNTELLVELRATRTEAALQQIKSVELFQNMKDRQMLRDVVWGQHKRKEQMHALAFNTAVGALMKFGPDLARRLGFVTDEEQAALQTTDAVSNWLAAMTEEQAIKMMAGMDPKQKAVFEKAWVGAKRRAAGATARAAITGRLTKQLEVGTTGSAADGSGITNGNGAAHGDANGATNGTSAVATGDAAASSTTSIELTTDEVRLLGRVTTRVLDLLAGLEEGPALDMVLVRVPPAMKDDVLWSRQWARDRQETQSKTPPTNEEKARLMNLRGVVVQLLSTLSELEIGMMLGQIPANARDDVTKMRGIVQTKFAHA